MVEHTKIIAKLILTKTPHWYMFCLTFWSYKASVTTQQTKKQKHLSLPLC